MEEQSNPLPRRRNHAPSAGDPLPLQNISDASTAPVPLSSSPRSGTPTAAVDDKSVHISMHEANRSSSASFSPPIAGSEGSVKRRGTLDRDDVSLTISRATAGSAGAGLAPSFDFSQFEKEAVLANRLEELCDLVIVLKKDCRPQIIECLLMYIAYAGLQFDVKKTPYGRYVVLLYATVSWFEKASEQLGCRYERRAPKLALEADTRGIENQVEVKYMHEAFTRNKRGQFIGQGGHMTHSRWRQFVLFSILSAPVMPSCENVDGQVDVPITGVGINRFIRLGQVKSIIAKHCKSDANKAIDAFKFRVSPFVAADAIRDYCGEEVAFLFHFLAFLQFWLVIPAVCGGLLSCYMLYLFFETDTGKGVGNNQLISRSVLASAYGIAFMLYMSLLAEQWKRHSNDLCFKWGTTNSDVQDKTRPRFQSSIKDYDHYSGVHVYVVSKWRRAVCIFMSIIALLPIVAGTILAHLGIMTWIYRVNFHEIFSLNLCETKGERDFACNNGDNVAERIILGCFFFGLVVAVQGKLTKRMSEWLTEIENYQTFYEADKALLYKVLPVEYIAHFFPLFYIAFVVRNMNNLFQCGFWVFVFTYLIKYIVSISEVVIAFFWRRSRGLLRSSSQNTDISLWHLVMYEAFGTFAGGFQARSVDILASVGVLPVFDHMLQVVMQVSYASVFALSFPAGSAICLVIVFFQARILASKVLITGARHITRASKGVGMWLHTLEVVFFISILVNGLICAVSSEVISGIVFNFCSSSSSSPYWQKVCDNFCDLRLGNITASLKPFCNAQLSPTLAKCSCFTSISLASGKNGPPITLNASGPSSTELWAFMLYEHVVVVLKFFLMGSMPRFSQYINDMSRAQQRYMQTNATNEPAPLSNVDDNDAYDGDVNAVAQKHYFVTQYLETTAKDTADAIRTKCEQPDSFLILPFEESSL